MEKRNTSGLRIAVTGPESTGKSLMAKYLSEKFEGIFVPEYAREYVQQIARPYNYSDIEKIARQQIVQFREFQGNSFSVFFDTWLIITKVWFDWVYNKVPAWLEDGINDCPIDLFLLMKPDIPWKADPTRENGGENRMKLFNLYKKELENHQFNYVEIGGIGEERYKNAEQVFISLFE